MRLSSSIFESILREEPDHRHALFCLGMMRAYLGDEQYPDTEKTRRYRATYNTRRVDGP